MERNRTDTDGRRAAGPSNALVTAVRLRRAAALVVAAAFVVGTGWAGAQTGDVDTELTPTVPKRAPETQWARLGGAEFGGGGELFNGADSYTPFTVDFFSVAFSPQYRERRRELFTGSVGFFAGAECVEAVAFGDLARCDDQERKDYVGRRPAMYRFWVDDLEQEHVERVELVEESRRGERGFVAAVAWLDADRALAVGGSGEYPRREPARESPTESDQAYAERDRNLEDDEGAGAARAWLYEDADADGKTDGVSEWRELELPPAMGALTALDCAPADVGTAVPKGTCYAGGMQRIWRWQTPAADDESGGFTSVVEAGHPLTLSGPSVGSSGTPQTLPEQVGDFHFRVRQIRLASGSPVASGSDSIAVAAVTSGCCDPTAGGARLLWSDNPNAGAGSWRAEPFSTLDAGDASARGGPLADSYYSVVLGRGETPYGAPAAGPRFGLSAIASPGGEPTAGSPEPGSRIVARVKNASPTGGTDVRPVDPTDRALDGVRLLAADGDFVSTRAANAAYGLEGAREDVNGRPFGDGLLDWAVGREKDSEEGVAYTTEPSTAPLPSPVTCKLLSTSLQVNAPDRCNPQEQDPSDIETDRVTDADMTSKRLLRMGTYALNAISSVPETDGGERWAVGDRGALTRMGGGGGRVGGASEPDATGLVSREPARLSERSAFDPFRAALAGAGPGEVPALADRPMEPLDANQLVPAGTPDGSREANLPSEDVSAVVMSRDGQEGWAVGGRNTSRGGLTMYHFDGERWTRCDVDGLGGALEQPDPACESLDALVADTLTMSTIARIPFERDGDPSNDDDFEVIAVGQNSLGFNSTVLRYVKGRWERDRQASETVVFGGSMRIAFVRPDDAWMTTGSWPLYRYVGTWPEGRWLKCSNTGTDSKTEADCGDPAELLPRDSGDGSVEHLAVAGDTVFAAGIRRDVSNQGKYPYVLRKSPRSDWVEEYDAACPEKEEEPCDATQPSPNAQPGSIDSMSAVDLGEQGIAAWLLGSFGRRPEAPASSLRVHGDDFTQPVASDAVLMRRNDRTDRWAPRHVRDAADDLIPFHGPVEDIPAQIVSVRGEGGRERSFITPPDYQNSVFYPPLEYDAVDDRWRVLRAPFVSSSNIFRTPRLATQGQITAVAPDNRGGVWVAAKSKAAGPSAEPASHRATFFHRYADERRRAVFEEAASPVSEPISGMAGTIDGRVWVSTESDRLYHYDRLVGWERLRIPGWERSRVVTRASQAFAVAVNDAGVGVVVGERGRIADLGPGSVGLNPASGRRCSDGPAPCGTPRDLRAAAVAPDGSAIAGGDQMALVWRPARGDFRTIARPRVPDATQITGVSMPEPGRAWITFDQGEIWAGTLDGDRWVWRLESGSAAARDERPPDRRFARLYAIRVQADGRGLAVGWRGAMLERHPEESDPERIWRRVDSGHLDNLHSIAFPPSGYGDGMLVGGDLGVILTRIDGRWRVARQADFTDPLTTPTSYHTVSGRIVGLALSGGGDGEIEAWAASQIDRLAGRRPFGLLHYGGGEDPLLEPGGRAEPLPDAPAEEAGEVTLAAFGRSECHVHDWCPEFHGTNLFNEVVTRRIQADLRARRAETAGAFAALFTGDISVAPGRHDAKGQTASVAPRIHTANAPNVRHDQWRELVAEPLVEDGVAVFGAIGKQDLTRAVVCRSSFDCNDSQRVVDAGVSKLWRESFAGMPEPWGAARTGDEAPASEDGVVFKPVEGDPLTTRPLPDVSADPDGEGGMRGTAAPGGAKTHYAVDIERGGERVGRIVVIDNSVARSLAASEPSQNPVEAQGQSGWLERVLCIKGETCAGIESEDARDPGQPVVVVSNAPTYSYGPGGLDAVQADGSALETTLVKHCVTAVVSGRLGWNGLFYTLAPGLHSPCPGGDYPHAPPERADQGLCSDQAPGGAPEPPSAPAAGGLVDELRGLGAPVPPHVDALTETAGAAARPIPNVIASTAGGKFGPRGTDSGSASDGFWHGYSIVRLRRDGEVIVEQRPILDWVGIDAQEHTLRPGQRMTLKGYGREPLGTDTSVRMIEINSPAVTHRYDLVMANPEQPYIPLEDANGDYVPLPSQVATINQQTGALRAGRGRNARTYAIGLLSVGEHAATWPIAFEPRRSFVAQRAKLTLPPLPRPARAPAAQQPLRLSETAPPPPAPPLATPGSPLSSQTLQPPPPPSFPQLPAAQAPPTPQSPAPPQIPAPPAPPAPPGVPPQQQPQPLALGAKVQAVAIVPSVNPPAPPPVNPAPPGGAAARKEAKQRQAATAKSEEGAGEKAEQATGDLANAPEQANGAQMSRRGTDRPAPATRRAQDRPAPSFDLIMAREQPSAWARGALYGGGLGLAALAFTAAWLIARPRPRRRTPDLPAPAWSRAPRR